MHPTWFEFDEDAKTPENCEPSQREFLRLVREGAREWPCRPSDTYVLFFPRDEPDEDGNTAEHDEMRLVVDLDHRRVRFLALGAALEADTVRCSELHICNFALTQECPDIVPRERTGPVEDLVAFTLGWLGEILRRPALRYDGRRY
ncbi:hypothetical protein [Streptomyces sp. LUP30]|uniref:hypothetical protein n=1 Tax=Streptomyces sp. LUP30 TaxID=1890285 RepID=UPI000851DE92|nr:hypothetical protein [Streptomyces sp. LUP30]